MPFSFHFVDCPSLILCICLSVFVFVCLSSSLSVNLCLCLSIFVFVFLSLTVNLYLCLSARLSFFSSPMVIQFFLSLTLTCLKAILLYTSDKKFRSSGNNLALCLFYFLSSNSYSYIGVPNHCSREYKCVVTLLWVPLLLPSLFGKRGIFTHSPSPWVFCPLSISPQIFKHFLIISKSGLKYW